MILCVPSLFDNAQSLRGYYLHRAHLVHAQLYTSKPVNKLLTPSCNPLSADEILSTTVPIKARCSSEIDARPRRPFSSSDRAPDGARLVDGPLQRPNAEGFGGPYDYRPALPDSK